MANTEWRKKLTEGTVTEAGPRRKTKADFDRRHKSVGQREMEKTLQRERDRMKDLLQNGMHEVYGGDWEEYLADYYPDYSWKPETSMLEFKAVLADPEWQQLAAQVKQQLNFDFVAELNLALKETYKELQ